MEIDRRYLVDVPDDGGVVVGDTPAPTGRRPG
jgi:hypothetical protein